MSARLGNCFAALADAAAGQLGTRLGKVEAGDPAVETDEEREAEERRRREEEAAALLAAIGLGDWSLVELALVEELAPVYGDGLWRGLGLAADEAGIEPAADTRFGLSAETAASRAADWAQAHAAAAVVGLEERTRDMLRATVADAIAEGWGPQRLARELRDSPGFGKYRAETIARTEIVDASNAGNFEAYRASGVVPAKKWQTAGDELVDRVCRENEAAGAIPLEAAFPSGHLRPGAHPVCRCVLLPVVVAV